MFQPTSRYVSLGITKMTTPDGRKIAYVNRRFLPQGSQLPLLGEVSVVQGERLDLLADRTLGDAEQFWQICDANNAMNPDDLTAQLGRRLRIPLPQI